VQQVRWQTRMLVFSESFVVCRLLWIRGAVEVDDIAAENLWHADQIQKLEKVLMKKKKPKPPNPKFYLARIMFLGVQPRNSSLAVFIPRPRATCLFCSSFYPGS